MLPFGGAIDPRLDAAPRPWSLLHAKRFERALIQRPLRNHGRIVDADASGNPATRTGLINDREVPLLRETSIAYRCSHRAALPPAKPRSELTLGYRG